jgi:starvation-inducible outer membrane lipoprotein
MLAFKTFRIAILVILSLSLLACITLPGHRQTIDEEDFYIHITAPDRATKELTRFNAEQTGIAYLPEKTEIELVVVDIRGRHQLDIRSSPDTIIYDYRLNGRKVEFGNEQQEWFASQVPRIISKTGLKQGPD